MARRKLSVARIKALAHLAHSAGLLPDAGRFRITPLRADQLQLLKAGDPELHHRSSALLFPRPCSTSG
jgi:hypothetical protein